MGRRGSAVTFEEAVARLEEIVRTLESGEVELDASLKLFAEGVELARLCQRLLDEAEGKVAELVDGEMRPLLLEGEGN
jgi:exodeoxyribonuclease VII small subunit